MDVGRWVLRHTGWVVPGAAGRTASRARRGAGPAGGCRGRARRTACSRRTAGSGRTGSCTGGAFPPYSGEQSGTLLTTRAYVFTNSYPVRAGDSREFPEGSCRVPRESSRTRHPQESVRRTGPPAGHLAVRGPRDQGPLYLGGRGPRTRGQVQRGHARRVRGRHRRTGPGRAPRVARVRRRDDGHPRGEQVEGRAVVGVGEADVPAVGRADGDRLSDVGGGVQGRSPALVACGDGVGDPGADRRADGRVQLRAVGAAQAEVGDRRFPGVPGDPVDADDPSGGAGCPRRPAPGRRPPSPSWRPRRWCPRRSRRRGCRGRCRPRRRGRRPRSPTRTTPGRRSRGA